jgi:hypothetical protein
LRKIAGDITGQAGREKRDAIKLRTLHASEAFTRGKVHPLTPRKAEVEEVISSRGVSRSRKPN